jgi:hypothetical protein
MFALTLIGTLARPTSGSRDRFFRQCFVDMDGLREQLGARWEPLMACALEGATSPRQKAALRSLVPSFGLRPIPEVDLAPIAAPTTLIWVATTAKRHCGSPSERAPASDGRCT